MRTLFRGAPIGRVLKREPAIALAGSFAFLSRSFPQPANLASLKLTRTTCAVTVRALWSYFSTARLLGGRDFGQSRGDNHIDVAPDELGHEFGSTLAISLRPAVFESQSCGRRDSSRFLRRPRRL